VVIVRSSEGFKESGFRKIMRTARGDVTFDIYAGKVKFDGQEFHIPVHVREDLTEVLLGRQWL
jgi:predicted aspartyl protease